VIDTDKLAAIGRKIDRVFIEREVFLRANHKVRYLKVSGRLQKWLAAAACFILAWIVFSSISFVSHERIVAQRDNEIERHKRAYFDLLAEVGEYHDQFARLTLNLEQNQDYLLSLLEQDESSARALADIREQLENSETERARVVVAREGLRDKLLKFEKDLTEIAGRDASLRTKVANMKTLLRSSEEDRHQVAQAREQLGIRLRNTETALSEVTTARRDLAGQVATLKRSLDQSRSERVSLLANQERLEQQIVDLQRNLSGATENELALDDRIKHLDRAYGQSLARADRLQGERNQLQVQVASLRTELDEAEARKAELDLSIATLEGALGQAVERGDRLDTERHDFKIRVATLERALDEAAKQEQSLGQRIASLETTLDDAIARGNRLEQERDSYRAQVASLDYKIATFEEERGVLDEKVASLEGSLGESVELGDQLKHERDFYEARVASLEFHLEDMRASQQEIVRRLTDRTLLSMDSIEKTVAMTGVDVNQLLNDFEEEDLGLAQGGPFVPGDFISETDPTYELQASIALLELQLDRWEALQDVVRSLPLIAPLDSFRVTSGFGARTDPLNGRKAIHYGIDFGAPSRTPVLTTAPGKVVFAGWRGRYGRMIEIDHGYGIRTRYGHLRKILVKPGQEVSHRDKIGLLGTSGRSTGPHVHYEVLLKGKPLDPMNFLKAGRHVFKG